MNKQRIIRTILSLFIILIGLSTSAGGGGTRWKTIRVDAGRTFHVTNSSLKLYGYGVPSIAYGADHLYYATQVGDVFETTIVDNNWGVGRYSSLAIDPTNGYPRISYYDATHDQLKYAEYLGLPGWNIRSIGAGGNKTAIALENGTNLPHIAYVQSDGNIWHAWKTCIGLICSWHTEEVDNTVAAAGSNISLAIDVDNHLHLAYYDSISSSLHYAYFNGTSWLTEQVPDPYGYGHYGQEPALALDDGSRPAIAYKTDSSINYAWKTNTSTPGTWSHSLIFVGSTSNTDLTAPSVQLPNGDATQPWISFIDGNGSVELAVFDDMGSYDVCNGTDGDYGCRILDDYSIFKGSISLLVDTSTPAYNLGKLIYTDKATGELRYKFESTPDVWGSQTVDHSTNAGLSSSLAVDASGPHIAYIDRDTTTLKYAGVDDSTPGGCGDDGLNAWYKCEGLDNAVVGSYDSIAIGIDGFPRIAFYDRSNPGALRYGTLNPIWSSIVIDNSSADIGRFASMALNPASNRMAIAYMDVSNGRLKYAKELSAATGNCGPSNFWQCDYIDTIGSSGDGISLTFGYNSVPLISYLDGDAQLVKVARYTGTGTESTCANSTNWDCDSIAPGYLTDRGQTSIWADTATSLVMVSWYQYNVSASNLMWSQFSMMSGWLPPERVADAMYSGEQNSLTVIGSTPVIAYTDGRFNRNALNYAYRVGVDGNCDSIEKWSCEVLDSAGSTGFYPSIKNISGRLYISYYDWTNGDLMLTFQAFSFLPLTVKP